MALVLLLILIAAEIGFLVFEAGRSSGKKEWTLRRLIVDLGQAVLFGIMLIFPSVSNPEKWPFTVGVADEGDRPRSNI